MSSSKSKLPLVVIILLVVISRDLIGQASFDDLVMIAHEIETFKDETLFSDDNSVSTSDYNEMLFEGLNSNSESFIYAMSGEVVSNGVVGVVEQGFDYLNSESFTVTHTNKIYLIGRVSMRDQFQTLVFRVEEFDFIHINMINFSRDGELLSAINLFEYSKNHEENIIEFALVESIIDESGNISQRTEADLFIDRTFILDWDGHFRIIEEVIKDYDE